MSIKDACLIFFTAHKYDTSWYYPKGLPKESYWIGHTPEGEQAHEVLKQSTDKQIKADCIALRNKGLLESKLDLGKNCYRLAGPRPEWNGTDWVMPN